MKKQRNILVTGVTGYWGSCVAGVLVNRPDVHVIGIDIDKPGVEIEGLDFIQTDVRNPLLVDLLITEKIDTVCHLTFIDSVKPSEAAFDVNIMGTVKVLGACAEAKVGQVIVKSSTAVYGAHPNNSAFLTEDRSLKGSRSYGYTRDMMEVEAFCNGFQRQAPEMKLAILRFSSIVGPSVDTPMTRFLSEPYAPVLFGFDPMMQVIHEDDVVAAIVHSLQTSAAGVFNVAAEGVLPLSKIMGLAGKLPLPVLHFFAYWGADLLGGSGLRVTRCAPIELDYIRYPWVGDLAKMRQELLFAPQYTAEETLIQFAEKGRVRRYMPEAVDMAFDKERLQDILDRRRRDQEEQSEEIVKDTEEGEYE
ncbi:MAG: NAD-dependent epimerase/dehydratase family protein [Anaerolineales bacterium]|jgi:UDP-glucose 4-epimerase